jgi:RNA polymerase sigma-70 factor, ECF subfamily
VLRDTAQSEEVTQEIFLEIWQNAPRFDQNKGTAVTWIMTMTHRRAVDRVRAAQSSRDRDVKIGIRDYAPDYDNVAESVEIRIEHERVKQAMSRLTDLQRQAVTLAYFGGYSHTEVAEMLKIPVGTIKTRLRDGMIRLRDELGVAS